MPALFQSIGKGAGEKMLSNNEKSNIRNFRYWIKQEKALIERLTLVRRAMADIIALADASGKCGFSETIYNIMKGVDE